MRIKIDENLPRGLVAELAAMNHDVDSVLTEGLQGCDDPDVWTGAQNAGRFLITQDLDFSDLRKFKLGTHRGLLLVRLPEAGRLALIDRICDVFRTEDVDSWACCFVILSSHKLRVIRPSPTEVPGA